MKSSIRSRSRTRSKSKTRSHVDCKQAETSKIDGHKDANIFSDGIDSVMLGLSKASISSEDSSGSKFIGMFESSKLHQEKEVSYESVLSLLDYLEISTLEFPDFDETSSADEINQAIELCSGYIIKIHTDLIPKYSGKILLYVNMINNNLTKLFIKMLILNHSKKSK